MYLKESRWDEIEGARLAIATETYLPWNGKSYGVRKLVHGNYVIAYRINESHHTVQVLGFTHGARIE